MEKPFSLACERNQGPILSAIKPALENVHDVLEIGSGTGQHAVYFAQHMPWLNWQCSDVLGNLAGINLWVDDANLGNLLTAVELDVSKTSIRHQYEAIYSCNTLHIMSKHQVKDFFNLISTITDHHPDLFIYGPFNYQGKFTSGSNGEFDRWLKEQKTESGIRDFEWVNDLAENIGFALVDDKPMPANNRLLHWHHSNKHIV
jgi:cyclopropane fatty-acyl-phospholipid synthase-like methyltransferase